MYNTRPEAAPPAVDELKRRARRRLVGAIVLALAAAVILPLLLESEPQPLGDDVSIRIPPIDSGKFVTPLSPAKAPDAKGVEVKRDRKSPNATGDGAVSPSKRGSETPAHTPASPSATSPAEGSAPSISPDPPSPPTLSLKERGDSRDGFVVQLAAFADVKSAGDLATTLKARGYPGYVEAFATAQGAMQRVRVGPYPSRDTADAALASLKAAGYDGIVSPAK